VSHPWSIVEEADLANCKERKLLITRCKIGVEEFSLCPYFRPVLHGEADVILAVDRHEFHHAVPEGSVVFRDSFFAFLQDFEVMLDGLAAGMLVVDFSLHLVKAALCLFVP